MITPPSNEVLAFIFIAIGATLLVAAVALAVFVERYVNDE